MASEVLADIPPSHPGEIFTSLIWLRRRKRRPLQPLSIAMVSGIKKDELDKLLDGKIPFTAEHRKKLWPILKTTADALLMLQRTYDYYQDYGKRPEGLHEAVLRQTAKKDLKL